jgi:hypothetical protein
LPKPRAAGQAESEIRGRLAISRPNLGATSATVISAQILAEFGHLKKRHNPVYVIRMEIIKRMTVD